MVNFDHKNSSVMECRAIVSPVASPSPLKLVILVASIWLFPSCALESGGENSDAEQPDVVQLDQSADHVSSNALDSAAE